MTHEVRYSVFLWSSLSRNSESKFVSFRLLVVEAVPSLIINNICTSLVRLSEFSQDCTCQYCHCLMLRDLLGLTSVVKFVIYNRLLSFIVKFVEILEDSIYLKIYFCRCKPDLFFCTGISADNIWRFCLIVNINFVWSAWSNTYFNSL